MTNRILLEVGWQGRIRSKLGVDEAYLPDPVIEKPEFITVAETNIISEVPDYDSLTGDQVVYLENAVVCECAALLCPIMKSLLPVREVGPHATFEVNVDWDKRRTELEAERDASIAKIVFMPSVPHFGRSKSR